MQILDNYKINFIISIRLLIISEMPIYKLAFDNCFDILYTPMHKGKLTVLVGSTDFQEWVTLAEKVLVVQILGLKGKKYSLSTRGNFLCNYLDLTTFAQIPHKPFALKGYHLMEYIRA